MDDTKIIGIAGLPRSGKDTVAEVLMARGFFGFSFGDYIREYARKRHAGKPDPISVANLTETANWLRDNNGPDVVLKAALKEFQAKESKYKGLVLFSVRAPVEVDWIHAQGGELLWVEASDKVRLERNSQNLRKGERPVDLKEFLRQENLQWQPQPGIPAEAQMNIEYVRSKADIVIENNGNELEAFKDKVTQKLGLK